MVTLTNENYFSPEADKEYLSVSQYKNFCGTKGIYGCEEMALNIIRGEWKKEMSTALLVGSYVDSHFEGSLATFKSKHPELFTKQNTLKSEFSKAEEIIKRIERDDYFMKYMSGEKQRIFTGELFGVNWKCKLDSYNPNLFITDLKIMRSIRDENWSEKVGHRINFIEFYGYDIQAAVYQKIVEINTGKELPFFIAAASKETYTDIEIIGFTEDDHYHIISEIAPNIQRIVDLKEGKAIPDRCGKCDYCKATKILTKPIHWTQITR